MGVLGRYIVRTVIAYTMLVMAGELEMPPPRRPNAH